MPSIVDPMDALKTFEPALRRGEIDLEPGRIDRDLMVHLDHPQGTLRITYVRFRGPSPSVSAMAIIIPAEPLEGKPVLQIGYAVPQHLRRRGLGMEIAKAAMAEFKAGMKANNVGDYYFEAVMGRKNVASQKIAEALIGGERKEVVDEHSGEEAYSYIGLVPAS